MTLNQATRFAYSLEGWLRPYCERLSIAGSIRRLRPICNDVDIVCIPKWREEKDLLGTVTRRVSLVHEFLVKYVAESKGKARWQTGEKNGEGSNFIIQLPKVQLDLWCATEATWGTLLMCRTGSKGHNIWVAQRAEAYGGHWNPYKGLTMPKEWVGASEIGIYRALGLPFIEARDREVGYLHKEFGLLPQGR